MTIREIFLEQDYNCAEAVLRWAAERYGLNIAPEDFALVSGFGGGLGCLSRARVEGRAHATSGFREECAELVRRFRTDLGSLQCEELKKRYRRPDVRCLYVVERAAAVLDEYMRSLEETSHA